MIAAVIREAERLFRTCGKNVKQAELMASIAGEYVDRIAYLKLLFNEDFEILELMAQRAHDITEKYFGKVLILYAPLYLSDYCTNGCVYCGYSAANKPMRRKKLDPTEMEAEMIALRDAGFDSVLLLTGGDRRQAPVDYISDAIYRGRKFFSEIILEIYALTTEEYRVVREAGASGLTIYQETYDRDLYNRVHLYGEKKDYDFRLEAPERAIEAGFKHINIGPLLGLGSANQDMFLAGVHGDYLQRQYPDVELCLSYPRLRPAANMSLPVDAVDDVRFVRFILATRLFLNRVGVSISTRENAHIRDHLVGLGMTRMSAGSCTTVGGYATPSSRAGQFEIEDDRSVGEIVGMIRSRGYRPEFTNWVKGLF